MKKYKYLIIGVIIFIIVIIGGKRSLESVIQGFIVAITLSVAFFVISLVIGVIKKSTMSSEQKESEKDRDLKIKYLKDKFNKESDIEVYYPYKKHHLWEVKQKRKNIYEISDEGLTNEMNDK